MSNKLLKITKSDKTVHVVPIVNKAFYQAYNKRQKPGKKWKIEEINEEDAKNIPFIDESFVTPMEAAQKLEDATKAISDKDARIAELEALLAQKNGGEEKAPDLKAAEKVELIKAATSVDQVKEIAGTDTRKSVIDAAAKRIAELEAQ